MPATPAAVLAELDPVRIVPLRLFGLVVTPLALLTREGDGDSNVSASHGSFGRYRAGVHTKDPARREVEASLAPALGPSDLLRHI
jgi:hypothetical protein